VKILVTGGAGFIGSHFVRRLLSEPGVENVIVLDNLTYAGRIENLEEFKSDSRFRFVKGDIRDIDVVEGLVKEVNFLVNFAAESHVDRSISDSSSFISTNIVGTHTLLEAVKKRTEIRYLQVSTDEVY
jgi:dTDP-glucose 4,6-dehydratase